VHTNTGCLESYRKILKVFPMCFRIAWHIVHQPLKMHCVSFQVTCTWFENHRCKAQPYLHYSVVVYLRKPTLHNMAYMNVTYTGLFEMIVGVLTTCHLILQMQLNVISFYGITSRIRFKFLLFPQVSRNWMYESEPPLKPSPLTCYKQFGTNSIIVLMFVELQRFHI